MKYFKKPNGIIIEYDSSKHDLDSLQDRFQECNADGSAMKKPKAKKKKED